jgi:aminodeoxyfutalosine synthase
MDPLPNIQLKLKAGQRLSKEDGLRLFQSFDILAIGAMAQIVRERMHGRRAFYAVNLHLNPTNICSTRCEFCAFSRDAGDPDAYALTLDEIEEKVREAVRDHRIREVHIVGGHNPALGLDHYTAMIRRIRKIHGKGTGKHSMPVPLFIKAFSATEIDDLAKRAGLSWAEVLRCLKEAGLDGMPGGGAEIFDPAVRAKICPKKISGETWLAIHRAAHGLGLKTNATMLYGHIETNEQRVAHLLRLCELQDETGGFSAFVPLPYHDQNNTLKRTGGTSGFLDLKMLSISRLLLDNIPHIKAHGSATDLKFVQTALSFGVDDIGGTNLQEKVFREAGSRAPAGLSSADLARCIRSAGFEPFETDSSYRIDQSERMEVTCPEK